MTTKESTFNIHHQASPEPYRYRYNELRKLPRWLSLFALVTAAGVAAMIYRLYVGLGVSTNLNHAYPWGLWIGFDLFMVAFSGGAFTLAALVYVFDIQSFHPAIRPTVLTGLLGYTSVLVILIMDLGRWDRFYHFIIYPNINSALFEVSWCILLYTTILISEFSPVILEKFGFEKAMAFIRKITVPLVIVGVTLSSLHQSSLGSLFVIMNHRLHPLWYTPFIPVMFFVSSIAAGLAMVIAGATVSYWVFHRSLPLRLVSALGSFLPWILGIYLILKLGNLYLDEKIILLWTSGRYSLLFGAELFIGAVVPFFWFLSEKMRGSRPLSLTGSVMVLAGIFLNRFNAAWFGLSPMQGYTYFPSFVEILIQAGVISGIICVYTLAGHYLPLFEGTTRNGHKSGQVPTKP